ncbi:hypothetical protein K8Z61_18510 [Nocardioides sp. TRM66260-LWL]|uniref:hypothetical protein n=1 Tax=Nocardioides sp. TRM66260-LWL TaxID=2874478 RepID=UPI001CC67E18|nr:hypothetical protein [Nocardioides sp. TRM66260-LWL]MBZ5736488.1 hypothetical protein [Nocardioides sp. TRM66260-LWL]
MSAGYEVVALFWEQITSKPGQPLEYVRHRRGTVVHIDDAAEVQRLVNAGAIRNASSGQDSPQPGHGDVSTTLKDENEQGKPATADELLADVGDDPEKAAAVLEVEKASDKPRSTLIAKLEKVIEKAAAES